MVGWKSESEKEVSTNRSDRSFHSTGDSCTRDSGAGDSVISETDNTSNPKPEKAGFVKQNIPLYYSSPVRARRSPDPIRKPPKPTFSTFVGDSDSESVHIVEYSNTVTIK